MPWTARKSRQRGAVGLLGLLLLYLIGGALWALTTPRTVRPSPVGIIVMIISGVLMVLFTRQKAAVGGGITELGTAGGCCRKLDLCLCACMAWAGLGGTLGVWALGWTWMDPVAALSIAYWVAREAWEAFEEVRETEGPEAQ